MFKILDDRVSIAMNVFIMAATVLNLASNFTQIWRTYFAYKHAQGDEFYPHRQVLRDFSLISLLLRFITNVIWVIYAICLYQTILLVANFLSLFTTLYLLTIKIEEKEKDKSFWMVIWVDLKRPTKR